MRMSLSKTLIDLFQKFLLRTVPKRRVVAKSAVLPLAYFKHILMSK